VHASIGWILIVSGAVTAAAGAAAFLAPGLLLKLIFRVDEPAPATFFFVMHWGVLIALVGGLTVYAASDAASRLPVLVAAATEKFVIVGLVFFGPLKRTPGMTLIAVVDGLFALTYAAYLAGL